MQIAYLEVQRRRSSNAKMKQRFDDALVDQLAASAPQPAEPFDAEVHMLRKCMGQLSPSEREMLTLRYGGSSVRDIADQSGRTVGSISQTLYRIRGKLSECIKRALGAERRHET
jgi:RNA polymerase sigma-70 factor (ECF subfamily)